MPADKSLSPGSGAAAVPLFVPGSGAAAVLLFIPSSRAAAYRGTSGSRKVS